MGKLIGAILAIPFVFVIAFVGAIFIALISAIPLYFIWNYLAPTYFSFLPPVWTNIGFWNLFLLVWCLSMIRGIIMPSASASATVKND